MNASADAVPSPTSTPTNRTAEPWKWRAAADKTGDSCRQTVHHDAQKLRTTT